MNIFYLDKDIKKCAEYHSDKHVVKMITETAQLLNSVYYFTGENNKAKYKLTHKNNPCAVWVRESLSNWKWLKEFGVALYDEYKYRYNNKTHKAGEVILGLTEPSLMDMGLTEFALAMPKQYRCADPVTAYRSYYIGEKKGIARYTNRDFPEWLLVG